MKLPLRLFALAGTWLASICRGPSADAPVRVIDCRVGDIVQLAASAEGDSSLAYQWQRNGLALAGETRGTLVIAVRHLSDSENYSVFARTMAGGLESETMVLRVKPLSPLPAVASIEVGGAVTFSFGDRTFGSDTRFQWLRNGVAVVGATNATFELSTLSATQSGSYSLLLTSPTIQVLSSSSSLALPFEPVEAPTVQTTDRNFVLRQINSEDFSRQPLALSVSVSGNDGLVSYRWQFNGSDLAAEDNSSLVVQNPRPGIYSVTASNSFGSATSRVATVSLATGRGRLRNIASVLSLGRAASSQSIGFYILGTQPKRMLTRAVGPTLKSFGITTAAEDPFLELLDASTRLVSSNDNWMADSSQASAIRQWAAEAGAFPLNEGSADAALVATVAPGGYLLKTTANSGTGELALAEVYDLDAAEEAAARISNFSRRDRIEIAPHALISSLVIDGGSAMTLLFRAVGPTLKSLGVPNAVSRAEITITDSAGQSRGRNAAWETGGNSPALIAVSSRVGAFMLGRGTSDAAMVSTLEPGSYTIQVMTRDAEPGEVLLEVYELE